MIFHRFWPNWLGLFFLFLFPAPSFAQTGLVTSSRVDSIVQSDAIQFPTEIYQIRPNSMTGPRFDLELPDGLSCSSSNGTPPSVNFYGGSTRRDNSYQSFAYNHKNLLTHPHEQHSNNHC